MTKAFHLDRRKNLTIKRGNASEASSETHSIQQTKKVKIPHLCEYKIITLSSTLMESKLFKQSPIYEARAGN